MAQPMPGRYFNNPDGSRSFIPDATAVYGAGAGVRTQPAAPSAPTGGVFDLDQGNLASELIKYGIRGGSLNLADFRRLVRMGHPEEGLKAAVQAAGNRLVKPLTIGSQLQEYFETGKTPFLKTSDGKDTSTPDLRGTANQDAFAAMTAAAEEEVVRDPETKQVLGYTEAAGVIPNPGKIVNLYDKDKKEIIGTIKGNEPVPESDEPDAPLVPAMPTITRVAKDVEPDPDPGLDADAGSDLDERSQLDIPDITPEQKLTAFTPSVPVQTAAAPATPAAPSAPTGGGGGQAGPDYAAMFKDLATQSALQAKNFQNMLAKSMEAQQRMFSDFMISQQRAQQQRIADQKTAMANAARAAQTADIKLGSEGNRNTFGIDAFKRNLKITPQTSTSLAISAPKGSTNKMLNV
jgi:hypothetical protein